jgi:hypothetical protein
MLVWGGWDAAHTHTNTGGRYDPAVDSWTATTTAGVPSARHYHTAVWTGSKMIVWGAAIPNTGGQYDPAGDSWTVTTVTGTPTERDQHTAVWTGSKMIVWGGTPDGINYVNTGGSYCFLSLYVKN